MVPTNLNHTLVFVYATLKGGYPNHALLSSAHFIGKAKTRKRYGFYLGPDPCAPKAPHIFPTTSPLTRSMVRARGEND
jgi:hypothetical protein